MITKPNFTFIIDRLTVPSAKTLGVLACGSAAIALWHRIDRRNDTEDNKVRNSVIQTTFLSLSSMFGMWWALSGSNVHSLTKAVATLCAGATTTIPVDVLVARAFSSSQGKPELKITVESPSSDTPVTTSSTSPTEGVESVLEEPLVDKP